MPGTSKAASPFTYSGIAGGIVDTTAVVIAPAVTNQRNFLSCLQYANTGTASEIVILDGATIIWRGFASTGGVEVYINFDVPLASSRGNTLSVQLLVTASATRVSAQGFVDP